MTKKKARPASRTLFLFSLHLLLRIGLRLPSRILNTVFLLTDLLQPLTPINFSLVRNLASDLLSVNFAKLHLPSLPKSTSEPAVPSASDQVLVLRMALGALAELLRSWSQILLANEITQLLVVFPGSDLAVSAAVPLVLTS